MNDGPRTAARVGSGQGVAQARHGVQELLDGGVGGGGIEEVAGRDSGRGLVLDEEGSLVLIELSDEPQNVRRPGGQPVLCVNRVLKRAGKARQSLRRRRRRFENQSSEYIGHRLRYSPAGVGGVILSAHWAFAARTP